MAARDQHRVLAVEADAGASGGLAVDVLVRVDEDAVGRAELAAERVELLAQLGVAVVPGVARQPAVARRTLGLREVVAEGGGDDARGAVEERLGMARDLGVRGREAEPPEEPAGLPLTDVPLGAFVGLGPRDADRVEAELGSQPLHVGCGHRPHCYSGAARNPCAAYDRGP